MPPKHTDHLSSVNGITQKLREMGIDVFRPETRFEATIAEALDAFSTFVLLKEKEKCIEILEEDLYNGGGSVGELQGGNESFSIYRVSFPSEDVFTKNNKCKNAAAELLHEFNSYNQQFKRHGNQILTFEDIKQYMLGMCDRRSRDRCDVKYTSLDNLMFILCFGQASGQVRHIDNMVPNLQICLYMSESCPSTIVYEMDDEDGPPVTDVLSLLDLWKRQNKTTPQILVHILLEHGDTRLNTKWYTKYFAFWKTINSQLLCFGKLYQPVLNELSLQTDPGTTLLAGGNEIHAGPPTEGPRMFAFAVGVPDPDETRAYEQAAHAAFEDDDNDGEEQYSPVLLHIDFCCLLFSLLDYDSNSSDIQSILEAKHFLVEILVELIQDYPMQEYLRQVHEGRTSTKEWLDKVLYMIDQNTSLESLIEDAIHSDQIFYTPDVGKMNSKKKKKRRGRSKCKE